MNMNGLKWHDRTDVCKHGWEYRKCADCQKEDYEDERIRLQELDEKGIFFCGNCGGTILKELRYEEKPTDDCGNCKFNDWIFEPGD